VDLEVVLGVVLGYINFHHDLLTLTKIWSFGMS